MQEYVINNYITLRLENNKTVIYVNNKVFSQCKYILLVNPQEKHIPEEINSIDEVSELYSNKLERKFTPKDLGITVEQEFWAHCSNIQAWIENDYDTRILHRNLAFPLLKNLTEAGDPLANQIFKDEIAIRFENGYPSVVQYLMKQGYLKYLNSEEIDLIFYKLIEKNIKNLEITSCGLSALPESILELKSLLTLDLSSNEFQTLPNAVGNLKSLQHLSLRYNQVSILPESIGNLSSLQELNLESNKLKTLPESIGNLKSLQTLDLRWNHLKTFPESMSNLSSLKELVLYKNNFTTLPESIGNLKSLKVLDLRWNPLFTLPESIVNLSSLKSLSISDNPLNPRFQSILKQLRNNGVYILQYSF